MCPTLSQTDLFFAPHLVFLVTLIGVLIKVRWPVVLLRRLIHEKGKESMKQYLTPNLLVIVVWGSNFKLQERRKE